MRIFFIIILLISSLPGICQVDSTALKIIMPVGEDWKSIEEGETFKVRISAKGGDDFNYRYGF